jgi:hypothetical protein
MKDAECGLRIVAIQAVEADPAALLHVSRDGWSGQIAAGKWSGPGCWLKSQCIFFRKNRNVEMDLGGNCRSCCWSTDLVNGLKGARREGELDVVNPSSVASVG